MKMKNKKSHSIRKDVRIINENEFDNLQSAIIDLGDLADITFDDTEFPSLKNLPVDMYKKAIKYIRHIYEIPEDVDADDYDEDTYTFYENALEGLLLFIDPDEDIFYYH